MLHSSDQRAIEGYVAEGLAPQVESILSDAHIFWWDTCAAEDADFVIVNRNGSIARAFQRGGTWTLFRNLGSPGSPFETDNRARTGISGPCLRECAQKMWLPDADEERLSFLPKELTSPGRRRVIVRDKLVTFIGMKSEGFALEIEGFRSPEFQGKPWESQAAVEWCVARCSATDAPLSNEQVLAHQQTAQVMEAGAAALDSIWGTF